jgi:DNA-directed RNA polymerase subunit F
MVMAVIFVMALLATAALAAEEQKTDSNQADNMQIVRDKLQADKKLLVAENMNLTQSEANAFWPVYESYQKELMALNDRAIKFIQNYAENFDKMTDNTAKKLVEDYLALENDRLKLKQSFLPKFAKVLPYTKVMRYYQLENKISAVVSFDLAGNIPLVK